MGRWVHGLLPLALAGVSALRAFQPPTPEQIEAFRAEGTWEQRRAEAKAAAQAFGNHRVTNGLAERHAYNLKQLQVRMGRLSPQDLPSPPPAWIGMPTTGKVNVLVVGIDFSDYPHSEIQNSMAQMRARIFGNGDGKVELPYDSYRNFYLRSSYGQLDLDGEVLGWYRPAYTRDSMPQTAASREKLIKEALDYYASPVGGSHRFGQYDNNGDGKIDFFAVVWSGPPGSFAMWWSYQTSFGDESYKVDGVGLDHYSWQWESPLYSNDPAQTWPFSPQVLCHETGHALGLPDLYDYDGSTGPSGGVGGLDIMDGGGDHNPFSKWLLGWITPTPVDTSTDTTTLPPLRDQATSKDLYLFARVANSHSPFYEYFLVQNRQRTGNDENRNTTGSGILAWHVDARLDRSGFNFAYDNSYTEHKLISLVEADGSNLIEQGRRAGDRDFFKRKSPPVSLGPQPADKPSTARYDGTLMGFGLRNFSDDGSSMAFDTFVVPADTTAPTGNPTRPVWTPLDLDSGRFDWKPGTSADGDGAIAAYRLQVGTAPGANDVYDGMINAGNGPSRTLTNLYPWDGLPLHARVAAANTAGLLSDWSEPADPVSVFLPTYPGGRADLDNPFLVFKAISGTPAWGPDTSTFVKGTSSAVAGVPDTLSRALMQVRLTGPWVVAFSWKADTQQDRDYYALQIDGRNVAHISGEVDWKRQVVGIPQGSHSVTWIYTRNIFSGGSRNLVWLDDVAWRSVDLDQDGVAGDVIDLGGLAWSWGSRAESRGWMGVDDLNGDGVVDDADIALFLSATGLTR